jgi:CheY-like chemotaxis protein
MRVLIVEDDMRMARLLDRCLREEGFDAEVAVTGEDALARTQGADFDADQPTRLAVVDALSDQLQVALSASQPATARRRPSPVVFRRQQPRIGNRVVRSTSVPIVHRCPATMIRSPSQ